MRWKSLEDALEVLETEREYDGYFCSIKDAVIIVLLGSLCEPEECKENTYVGTGGTRQKVS